MAKVLIIGAGLGGLTLANILHKNGVPYEIFERDTAQGSRRQGWAVALVESLEYLEKDLPQDLAERLHSNSVNLNTGDHDELGFVDGTTGVQVGAVGGVSHGQQGYFLRVSREHFRNYLMSSNELNMSWGKNCVDFTEDTEGVTAHFKDGSSSRGTVLIGADGAHSHVLNRLIGEARHKLAYSEQVPIFGEVALPPNLYEPLRERGNAVILAATKEVRLQIGMLHMEDDKSEAAFFWALMLQRDDPEQLSDWLDEASRQEIFEFAMKSAEVLHPVFKDAMLHGGPDSIVKPQPKFLEFEPPHDLPRGRVTILGDAAHAMIPFRGAGANTAILDACDLGERITEAWKQQKDLAGVIDEYLNVMVPRGIENVVSSRKAGQSEGNEAEKWAVMFARKKQSA